MTSMGYRGRENSTETWKFEAEPWDYFFLCFFSFFFQVSTRTNAPITASYRTVKLHIAHCTKLDDYIS